MGLAQIRYFVAVAEERNVATLLATNEVAARCAVARGAHSIDVDFSDTHEAPR